MSCYENSESRNGILRDLGTVPDLNIIGYSPPTEDSSGLSSIPSSPLSLIGEADSRPEFPAGDLSDWDQGATLKCPAPAWHIDFPAIAAAALAVVRQILASLFPAGVFHGDEFLIGNLAGDAGKSLAVSLSRGVWKDFATNEAGGDLISLYAAHRGIGQGPAALAIERMVSVCTCAVASGAAQQLPVRRPQGEREWTPLTVVPLTAPDPGEIIPRNPADLVYRYYSTSGELMGAVLRWNRLDCSKVIRPVVWCRHRNGSQGWRFGAFAKLRPLYRLNEIASRSAANVLVVEGEKAADAAQKLLPHYICTTWAGGASAVRYTDWNPLLGRRVVIWPDADDAGLTAAGAILEILPTAQIIAVPDGWTDGRDLADALPDGWTSAEIESHIEKRVIEHRSTAQEGDLTDSLYARATVPTNECNLVVASPSCTVGGVEQSGIPEAYFDPTAKGYWILNDRGCWILVTEGQLRRQLKPYLRSKPEEDEALPPLDQHLNRLQTTKDVNYAGPLAGSFAGVRNYHGNRLLITTSPTIVQPVAGEWSTLKQVLNNLLGALQLIYFFAWLKLARESLIAGSHRPGQFLVIAGPANCGKTLLQDLITPLLGNRAAKPHGWMTDRTDFNSELFGGEHLVIDDEAAKPDIRSRRAFGAKIKEVTVAGNVACHPKGRPKVLLRPFWRGTLSVNDEAENLNVLPVLDDSIRDKVMLLLAEMHPMPMPTTSLEERDAFWATLMAELPAFVAYLNEWKIPEDVKGGRFGCKHYHHPEILQKLDDLAPENHLWDLIVRAYALETEFEATANKIETKLRTTAATREESIKLFTFNTACGVYLARLMAKYPDRIGERRIVTGRIWKFNLTGLNVEDQA